MTIRQELARASLQTVDPADVKNTIMAITSGTTGADPVVTITKTNDFKEPILKGCHRAIVAWGSLINRLHRVIREFYRLEPSMDMVLALDQIDCDDTLDSLLNDFEADYMQGIPAFELRISEHMYNPNIRARIRIIILSGERLTLQKKQMLEQRFPNARIVAGYGTAEVGRIASSRCSYLPLNCYHPYEDVRITILHADENGLGSIAVTKRFLDGRFMKEFETGDLGRFIKTPCQCGNPITFEIMGRVNFDRITLGGALVRQDECERVVGELREYILDYRAVAEETTKNGRILGSISINIIPTSALHSKKNSEKFIAHEISRRLFLTPTQTLEQLAQKGLFMPLQVRLVEEFPPGNKEIKLRLREKV